MSKSNNSPPHLLLHNGFLLQHDRNKTCVWPRLSPFHWDATQLLRIVIASGSYRLVPFAGSFDAFRWCLRKTFSDPIVSNFAGSQEWRRLSVT